MRLQEFGPDIWIADGPVVKTLGFSFPTRMIVVRLSDGRLWINSPVVATDAEKDGVAALGPVSYLIAPTPLHAWRFEGWAEHFPQAQLFVPPRMKCTSPAMNVLGDTPPEAWASDLDQMIFRGSAFLDEAYFLHRASKTLVLCDFIQNYPPRNALFDTLMKAAGIWGGGTPLDIRLSFLFGKTQGRESLEKLLSWDFEKVILAHGDCVVTGAKAFVRNAFSWLAPS